MNPEQEYEQEAHQEALEAYCIENNIWITANGQEIPIAQMSNGHLENALAFIQTHFYNSEWENILATELRNRI